MAWTKVVTESSASNIAQTAAKAVILETGRTISTTGEVTVTTGTFNGSANVTGAATIANNVVDEANLKISNSASDGMFLQYKDGTDELTWATPTDVSTVANLTDTTIDSPADNEVLAWNGSDTWINQTASEAGLQPLADDLTTLASCQTGAATALAALTATEIGVIDGLTASTAELNNLDFGVSAIGTAIASKAVVLDANKDYTGIRNLTITGELDAATLDISGDVDIDGTLETDAFSIGSTAVTSTAAELNILDGVTATSTELNYLDITTLGTSEASKAVTADASGHVTISDGAYDFDIASHDGTNGLKLGGTLVTASAAELNYVKDVTSAIQTQLDGKQASGTYYTDTLNATYWQTNADRTIGNSGATLTVAGNLTVSGATTTVDTATITVEDKNIQVASGAGSLANASGAGLSVKHGVMTSAEPEIQWIDTGTTEQNLTGWNINDNGDIGHHEIAVMSFSEADGTGNGAGVGSFHYDTSGDALWIRTS